MKTIYIPSKGRTGYPITSRLLESHGVPFVVVVDPSELSQYKKIIGKPGKVISVDLDDQGLPAARSWIKRYSTMIGEDYHWQLEDDISQFFFRRESKGMRKITPAEALEAIETEVFKFENISIASPDHNSWPPNPDEPVKVNGLPHHAALINNATDIFWRQFLYEDVDFALQSLSKKYCTMLFKHIRLATPAPKAHAGGQTERYGDDEKTMAHMECIANEWPTLTVKRLASGKPQLRFNKIWSTFTQRPRPARNFVS